MVGFLIAIASGILMSLQGVFNTAVTKQSSIWSSSSFVHFSALVVCLIAWLVTERTGFSAVFSVRPRYLLTGGIIGAFITYTVIVSMAQMGPAKAVMFIVVAQLISSYLIEVLGWFGVEKQPLTVQKIIGMAVAIFGVILFKWE
nr:DMT family transporter [Lachnospiraceae bacterium]